jgi:hypothetical protein
MHWQNMSNLAELLSLLNYGYSVTCTTNSNSSREPSEPSANYNNMIDWLDILPGEIERVFEKERTIKLMEF